MSSAAGNILFILTRYGSREVLRRTRLKVASGLQAAADAIASRRAWKQRARFLDVREGEIACVPRGGDVRILVYARDAGVAARTTQRWACALGVPVSVVEDPSAQGLAASVAAASADFSEPLVAVLTAGMVPLPDWLDALRDAMHDPRTVAAGGTIVNARKRELTRGVEENGARYLREATRLPIAGSLIRRETAAALNGDALAGAQGELRFQPRAVAIDLFARKDYEVAIARARMAVLFCDEHAPYFDREGGGLRMWHLLQIARFSGARVVFAPLDGRVPEPYLSRLERRGIEVVRSRGSRDLQAVLGKRAGEFDVAWLSRPHVMAKLAPVVRAANPGAGIVYDTVDLHHVRLQRRERFASAGADWHAMLELETELARQADAAVAVTEEEKAFLENAGARNVAIVPTLHEPVDREPEPFEKRAGLLFIGSYDHEPNVDAAQYLCSRIMPRVCARLPGVHLTLLGNNPPPAVRRLASDSVSVPGYVADPAPYFERSRVFVVPLRYGAGVKAKLTQAFAFGLPAVTTPCGAEGIAQADAFEIAEGDDAFADAVVRVYGDRARWQQLSAGARAAARSYDPERVSAVVLRLLETRALDASASSAERSVLPITPR